MPIVSAQGAAPIQQQILLEAQLLAATVTNRLLKRNVNLTDADPIAAQELIALAGTGQIPSINPVL